MSDQEVLMNAAEIRNCAYKMLDVSRHFRGSAPGDENADDISRRLASLATLLIGYYPQEEPSTQPRLLHQVLRTRHANARPDDFSLDLEVPPL